MHLCKLCASEGRISYGKLEVHHIEPLSERFDLRLDLDNLVSLCGGCHEKADGGRVARKHLRKIAASKVPPLLFRKGKV
ncbi:MAG: HNH endonuclease [Oscillospiraceae bacterium]|nr:HNH endonuclease [Oscillospiraceae bacterium]